MKLSVHNLDAFYGAAQILFQFSLKVNTGEAVALLGRNGAGKTTSLKAILGLVTRRGRVVFDGRDVTRNSTERIVRSGLGYVPEDRRIFAGLTIEENLLVGQQKPRPGAPTWTPERLYSLFPSLARLRRRRGNEISGGEQQMLAIARTLMGNPSLIMLDEPSEGLAPLVVDAMADAVLALKSEGLGVLLAEQNLRFASRISDRAAILEKGRIRYEGTFTALMADEDARHAYLAV